VEEAAPFDVPLFSRSSTNYLLQEWSNMRNQHASPWSLRECEQNDDFSELYPAIAFPYEETAAYAGTWGQSQAVKRWPLPSCFKSRRRAIARAMGLERAVQTSASRARVSADHNRRV